MKITITGRHFDVSDELRDYTEKKLDKLEKYFKRLIGIRVTMYMEKHLHIIDVVINADGVRFYATEKADDMYTSVDMMIKSIEKQVSKHKDRVTEHKVIVPEKAAPEQAPAESDEVLVNYADRRPMDEIEAYLEMKVDNRDFILFKKHICYGENIDETDESYAAIFSSNGSYKMVEIPVQMIKNGKYDASDLLEFDLHVGSDSATDPKIDFKKTGSGGIGSMTVNNAVKELIGKGGKFLPFFNNETNQINVVYKAGSTYAVMIPSA